jgi:K+-transporting ATPase KdpF subunit
MRLPAAQTKNSHRFVCRIRPHEPKIRALELIMSFDAVQSSSSGNRGIHGNHHRGSGAGTRHHDLSDLPAGSGIAGAEMSVFDWVGLLLSVGIGIYLVIALLFPEKFE